MIASTTRAGQTYLAQMVHLVTKIFKLESNTNIPQINIIFWQLNQIPELDTDLIQKWLDKLVKAEANESDRMLIELAIYFTQDKSDFALNEVAALSLLSEFIHIASKAVNERDGAGFPQLISLMQT